jgi:hypothetical protein
MDLSSISEPLNGLKSGRFFIVNYLPTCAASLFILVLIWAGAPVWMHQGQALSFNDAWKTAKGLGVGEILLLTVAVTLIAVLFAPLQLKMMRIMEGGGSKSLAAEDSAADFSFGVSAVWPGTLRYRRSAVS